MKFGLGGGGDFKPVEAGTHMAVCTQIVDIGLQKGSEQFPKPQHKVVLRFEIPSERIEFDGKDAPAVISKSFTASMNEKATLRKYLESWRGKTFTDAEAEQFDVSKLLGVTVMLSVVHKESGGKVRANIAALSAPPKGMPPVKPEGEVFIYDEEHKENYDKLSKYLKESVDNQIRQGATADEVYGGFATVPERKEAPATTSAPDPFDDQDIPF